MARKGLAIRRFWICGNGWTYGRILESVARKELKGYGTLGGPLPRHLFVKDCSVWVYGAGVGKRIERKGLRGWGQRNGS